MNPSKRLLGVVGFVLAVLALSYFLKGYRIFQLAQIGTYFVAIMGLSLLTGYNGQISLGHGAFMALGGYTTAILMTDHGVKDVATIPVAVVVAACPGKVWTLSMR